MGLFDGFLKQVATGDEIKDYKHASKLFVSNNYARSPKYGWLYHVFFDLNPMYSRIGKDPQIEAGMLVKAVDFPKIDVETKVQNSYNRTNIVQTKLKYSSLRITFHDDTSNIVRNMWVDYNQFYYRDTDIGYDGPSGGVNQAYYAAHKYTPFQRDQLNKFGYTPRSDGPTTQYIQAIRIYSLAQKKFTEYTLVNPTIIQFSHGNHMSDSTNTLEHTMTVQFETVLYSSGYITPGTVSGFADLHYDKSPSPLTPLGGGTQSILGPGGLLNSATSVIGAAASGNWGQAILTGAKAIYANRNTNLKQLAKNELITIAKDVVSLKNPADRFYVPTVGSVATNPIVPAATALAVGTAAPNSVSSNGSSLNLGSPVQTSGVLISATGNPGTNSTGVNTTPSGAASGGAFNKLVNITYNSPLTVVGVTSTSDQFTYEKALAKIAEDKAAAVDLENKKTEINPLLLKAAATIPIFSTGTNSLIDSPSPLQQTPYANKIIPPQEAVANYDAAKFITNGNPVELVENTIGRYRGGTSTTPAK